MASLRQRMLEDMQVRRLSPCTQRTYVETAARFARYFDRSPARLGPEEISSYQVYLTNERRLAPSSLVVVVSALRFLYWVTLRKRWLVFTVPPAVDGDRIRGRATCERPRQPSEGTVNGRFAVQDGDAAGALAGRSIRRP